MIVVGGCSVLYIWVDIGGVGVDFMGIFGGVGILLLEKKL